MWTGVKGLARRILLTRLRRAIQGWRLQRLQAHFPTRVVHHDYGGGELAVVLADPLGQGWYDHDWLLPPEFELLRKSKLQAGATVFDLGAHQGIVALMLAREVGETGKVVAVEALPHNAAVAARNRDLNHMPWVEVVSAAIAAHDGKILMSQNWNSSSAAVSDYGGTVEVPAITIDSLAIRYGAPSVVYLDVEGMEVSALEGARQTLARKPDVFVEVHTKHGLEATGGTVEQVLAHFPDSEFEKFVYSERSNTVFPLSAAPPELVATRFFLTALSRH